LNSSEKSLTARTIIRAIFSFVCAGEKMSKMKTSGTTISLIDLFTVEKNSLFKHARFLIAF